MEMCTAAVAKYPRFVHDYIRMIEESKVQFEKLVPRDGWQSELFEELLTPANPRQVIWYIDSVGNSGKSYFATHWQETRSYYVTGGKAADIYYGYEYQPVVFFDLARMKQEIVQYDVMESFKNGQFYSTKYECKTVKFTVPHVVVFSNFQPNLAMLSEDRWVLRVLN